VAKAANYKRHSNVGYSRERPVCAGCLKPWVNRHQPPWQLVTTGEEPYVFTCSWACLSAYAGNRAKEGECT